VTHWPYIAAAYVIAIGMPLVFSIEVAFRTRSAHRRLRAIDPRPDRSRT
jgi:predicted signal transduction protein with EAL and GGDEF domain